MLCARPRSRRGVRRKRSSLCAPTVAGRSRPAGHPGGTVTRAVTVAAPGPPLGTSLAAKCSARVTTPRAGRAPSRSSHATRYEPPDAVSAARISSSPCARSVSTESIRLLIARSRIRARRITPVRPIPPRVASSSSAILTRLGGDNCGRVELEDLAVVRSEASPPSSWAASP